MILSTLFTALASYQKLRLQQSSIKWINAFVLDFSRIICTYPFSISENNGLSIMESALHWIIMS